MMLFSNLNPAILKIFVGNLLLLLCCLLYLAWWTVVFKPDLPRRTGGTFFIASAFITGITSILLISSGSIDLAQVSQILPIKFILLGGIAMFIVMLSVTKIALHRPVTSELFIIHLWAILELTMIDVLFSNGHFVLTGALGYLILIGLSTIASLVCYVLYYRLNETARYRVGMVPLVLAAICALAFLCCKFNDYMLI